MPLGGSHTTRASGSTRARNVRSTGAATTRADESLRGTLRTYPDHPVPTSGGGGLRRPRGLGRARRCGEPEGEGGADLGVTQEERPLVEALAPQPAGDLVVALAGVARAARRGDVRQRVTTAARQREHAVPLERPVGGPAVRAAAPLLLQRRPLVGLEVVLDPLHPARALAS